MSMTILFGSGADTNFNSDFKSGAEFSGSLLNDGNVELRRKILGDDFVRYKLIYSNSRKVFLQTISEHYEEAIEVIGKSDVDECIGYYNRSPDCKYEKSNIDKKLNLFRDFLKGEDNKIKNFFLKNAVFFDSLDSKFNSLRNGGMNANAKRVINAYWTIYIFMLKIIYGISDEFDLSYESLFELLKSDYGIEQKNEKSYYSIVNKYASDVNLVTTNYTDICEKITGKQVTYLHGNMHWFEDLKNLTVYDCHNPDEMEIAKDNTQNLIPFILIPSGIKPIICKKEMCEFSDFGRKLDESTELCTIGYRFNTEDNHINSIIAQWLREGKHHRMTFFNYMDEPDRGVDLKRFNWYCDNFNVNIININKENCLSEFKNYIKNYFENKQGGKQ